MKTMAKMHNGAAESCAIIEPARQVTPRCGRLSAFDPQRLFSTPPAPISFAFKAWRQRQTFATPEIAKKAEHVEADLRALEKGAVGPNLLAVIARNVREFEAMLRG